MSDYPISNVRTLTVRCPSCKGNEYLDTDDGETVCGRCHGAGEFRTALRDYLTGGAADDAAHP